MSKGEYDKVGPLKEKLSKARQAKARKESEADELNINAIKPKVKRTKKTICEK